MIRKSPAGFYGWQMPKFDEKTDFITSMSSSRWKSLFVKDVINNRR